MEVLSGRAVAGIYNVSLDVVMCLLLSICFVYFHGSGNNVRIDHYFLHKRYKKASIIVHAQ